MRLKTAKKIIVQSILETKDRKDNQMPICPFILGSMGIGKSYMVREIAKDLDMYVVEVNLAQYEPSDIGGMQMPSGDTMKVLKPKWLLDDEERQSLLVESGYRGIMYFFDELPQAPILNQNIFAQICNEYRIGDYNIPKGDFVISAGNRMSDRSGTNQMPMHLKDRLTTIEIEPNLDDFCSYMLQNKKDARIVSWVRFQPEFLHKFDRDANAFPTPRSHERTSDILSWKLDEDEMYHAVACQIGESASASLFTHIRIFDKCPKVEDIIANPNDIEVPSDLAIQFATTSALVSSVNDKNMGAVLKFMNRIDGEFLAYFIKDSVAKNRELLQNKELRFEMANNKKLRELVL